MKIIEEIIIRDMIRIPGKIPIRITPGFWLVAAIIGFLNSLSFFGTLFWIAIILVSVLFHELGHALAALGFGQHPRIELVPFGGATYPEGPKLKLWKEFLVVFNGPFFGFLLFLFASFVLTFLDPKQTPLFYSVFQTFRIVNLFWTIINLLPVMPLDGGQLLRIILESIFGYKAMRYALFVGMFISAGLSLYFFLAGFFLVGAIFFLFAFQNFETWRRSRFLSQADRVDQFKELLQKGEMAFQMQKKEEAREIFSHLRSQTKKGILYSSATQRLAQLEGESGNLKAVYDMLMEVKGDVSEEIYPLFQRAAFEAGDYQLVEELGNVCFRNTPNGEIAIRNANACAALGKTKATVGWLRAALREGAQDVLPIIDKPFYDSIRNNPELKKFLESIK